MVTEAAMNPALRSDLPSTGKASATAPMIGGEMASPSTWMMKMLMANAAARIDGWVTLARTVLVGPVLKKRQKQVMKISTQARGNGVNRTVRKSGNPRNM